MNIILLPLIIRFEFRKKFWMVSIQRRSGYDVSYVSSLLRHVVAHFSLRSLIYNDLENIHMNHEKVRPNQNSQKISKLINNLIIIIELIIQII